MSPARISEALHDLVLDRTLGIDEAMDRYFAPGFEHHNHGTRRSRAEFAAMATRAREEIVGGTITVLDELRDGHRYAERHVYEVDQRDGSTQRAEIYVIGELDPDGRFRQLHEAGFPVPDPTA